MTSDVAVIGAGLIGCAAARGLAQAGLRVVLVDPGRPCREASWAAAGMLAVHVEAGEGGAFFELCQRSRALFPDLVAALHEETGIDAELIRHGTLVLMLADEAARRLETVGGRGGARAERLDGEAVRRLEPWVTDSCRWALYLPDDIRLNSRRLCEALVASLEARGVPFRLGRPVVEIVRRGATVSGVRLAGGERIEAGTVLLAAGAWSGLIQGLPRPLPVEPCRGQVLALGAPAGAFRHTLIAPGTYLVPRSEGGVVVGATMERVGFDKRVTAHAIATLLGGAERIAPRLKEAEFLEAWAGLRPATADDLPILGPDPDVRGLFYATGHFRNGILLAPVTAQIVVERLTSSTASVPLEAFRPDRFPAPAGADA